MSNHCPLMTGTPSFRLDPALSMDSSSVCLAAFTPAEADAHPRRVVAEDVDILWVVQLIVSSHVRWVSRSLADSAANCSIVNSLVSISVATIASSSALAYILSTNPSSTTSWRREHMLVRILNSEKERRRARREEKKKSCKSHVLSITLAPLCGLSISHLKPSSFAQCVAARTLAELAHVQPRNTETQRKGHYIGDIDTQKRT